MKVSQLAKKINKTRKTIWNYMDKGILRYHQDVKHGSRYFIWNEVLEDLGMKPTIGYCRVSTKDQIKDLEYQKQLVEQYCAAKGYKVKIIEDIGSGINYNKKGLKELINIIISGEVQALVITYPDRLLRFGNEIIFTLCEKFNINVEIINQKKEISKEEELVQNVI
jgi:predicted site-specific integrase-resolvase